MEIMQVEHFKMTCGFFHSKYVYWRTLCAGIMLRLHGCAEPDEVAALGKLRV